MMSHRYFKILVCHGLLLASSMTSTAAEGFGDEQQQQQLQHEQKQRVLRPKRVRRHGLIKIGDRQPEEIARNAKNFVDEEERIQEEEDIIRALQISRELQSMSKSGSGSGSRKSGSRKKRGAGAAQEPQLFN